ncbi:hypothetical protein BurJ1DRAFT_2411 [Burkholderiales bacterium JOSHI_001]|nr:hypothetical protein BurJ1DRAFT_2411 [Burkholderiales bacterium JOSHI_001]
MKTNPSSNSDPSEGGVVTVHSADGMVRFSLQRTSAGLYVQRAFSRNGKGKVLQTVHSADGMVRFSLQRTSAGLYVQRAFSRNGKGKVLQSARFASADDFRRWCAADTIRFDDPLMSLRLVRHADELFADTSTVINAG